MRSFPFLLALSIILPPVAGRAGERAPDSGKAPLPETPATEAPQRSHFRFSAGAAYRSIQGAEFFTGSRSGRESLPFPSSALRGIRSGAGAAGAYADRQYTDGYVFQDGGTAGDGSTWFWGYENPAQVAGSRLSFHAPADSIDTSHSERGESDPGAWSTDDGGAVPVVSADWSYDLTPRLSAGFSLQYSYLGFDGGSGVSNFRALQVRGSQAVNLTDVYDIGEIVAPSAPYQGSLEGPGSLINNRPASRSLEKGGILDSSRTAFFNQIRESLDVRLHTLALGPTLTAHAGPVDLALGGGLALNIADWDASHRETLYRQSGTQQAKVYKKWSDQASGTEVLPGAFLQASASVDLGGAFRLTAFGNYDWSRTFSGQVGPSRFRIDPSGWMAGGMIGFSF